MLPQPGQGLYLQHPRQPRGHTVFRPGLLRPNASDRMVRRLLRGGRLFPQAGRAVDLGHATLRKQILDPSHPAYGVLRTSSSVASTVDTLFLVGWGWMPLYKATGDRLYVDAAEKVAEAAKRLIREFGERTAKPGTREADAERATVRR